MSAGFCHVPGCAEEATVIVNDWHLMCSDHEARAEQVIDCPAHSPESLYVAVRNTRRGLNMPPQECSCEEGS